MHDDEPAATRAELDVRAMLLRHVEITTAAFEAERARQVAEDDLQRALAHIARTQPLLRAMRAVLELVQSSKFWKLRNAWFALKKRLRAQRRRSAAVLGARRGRRRRRVGSRRGVRPLAPRAPRAAAGRRAHASDGAAAEVASDVQRPDAGLRHTRALPARGDRFGDRAGVSVLGALHRGRCVERPARARDHRRIHRGGFADQSRVPRDERAHRGREQQRARARDRRLRRAARPRRRVVARRALRERARREPSSGRRARLLRRGQDRRRRAPPLAVLQARLVAGLAALPQLRVASRRVPPFARRGRGRLP